MRIQIALRLPRDGATVPVVRHLCGLALEKMGTTAECVGDVKVVLSEACTNVLQHAQDGDQYEVEVDIEPDCCRIRIVDSGPGIDGVQSDGKRTSSGDAVAERGRGVPLIEALVDRLDFENKPGVGMVVHVEKQLSYTDHDGPRLRPY